MTENYSVTCMCTCKKNISIKKTYCEGAGGIGRSGNPYVLLGIDDVAFYLNIEQFEQLKDTLNN